MAGLDPWSYASKSKSEHAEQVALFMWANMAMRYGPIIAADPLSYNKAGFAKTQFEGKGELGFKRYAATIPQLKWLHAIHNQGHGDAVRGGKAKAEGVKAGVADIFLPVAKAAEYFSKVYHGLYMELKRKEAGTPSDIQLEFQTDMRAAGYQCEIIHGWELARDCILSYLGVS